MEPEAPPQPTLRRITIPSTPRVDGDCTLEELADLESRVGRPLTRSVLMSNPEALEAVKRTAKRISAKTSARLRGWVDAHREELAYVDSLPPSKRKQYEHMTMPEIRRMMDRAALNTRPPASRRGDRGPTHHRRAGARRASGTRSGSDPGDPEPPRRRFIVDDHYVVVAVVV